MIATDRKHMKNIPAAAPTPRPKSASSSSRRNAVKSRRAYLGERDLLRFRQVSQLITNTAQLIGIMYRTSIEEWLSEPVSANPYILETDFPIQAVQAEFPA